MKQLTETESDILTSKHDVYKMVVIVMPIQDLDGKEWAWVYQQGLN